MKKLLFLLPILIVPSAVNAAAVCKRYYVLQGTQPMSGSEVEIGQWGSYVGAASYSFTYYKKYESVTSNYEYVGYVAAVTSLTCNTTQGYTKSRVLKNVCLNSSTATPSDVTVYKCECSNYDTYNNSWTSYSTAAQRDSGTRKNCGTSSTIYRYRCKSGYYSAAGYASATTESALQCTTCPANATCSAGAKTFTCNAGYYKDGNACTACATTCGAGHTTSGAGATSYAECKAPAATMLTDDTGTFSYSTACCCDDTCDSKCDSGKSCDIDSDCDDDNICSDGCCVENPGATCTSGYACTTVSDCPTGYNKKCSNGCCIPLTCSSAPFNSCYTDADCGALTPKCIDGCCSEDPNAQTCSKLSEDYCTLGNTSNCGPMETCNTFTNCCEPKKPIIL